VARELDTYRGKRDAGRTPEPVPDARPLPAGNGDTFVIQEHHARALHWDFRLERDGVLVSWAVPKGLPLDPKTNHLAVQTEDHPLEYAAFAGDIPAGEYGGGHVIAWDHGTYEREKWTEREVKVVLHGSRISGRYVLFRTRGKRDWMIHRMDPPPRPGWRPVPALVQPMQAQPAGALPAAAEDALWGYEMAWDGERAVVYVDGGRIRTLDGADREVTAAYPELRPLGAAMGSVSAVFDGEIVAFDATGQPSTDRLEQRRTAGTPAAIGRLVTAAPVTYLIFDLLHLDGEPLIDVAYAGRRRRLDELGLAGPSWQTPPYFPGGGVAGLRASQEQGLAGVVAKRQASTYRAGRQSGDWLIVAGHGR